MMMPDVGLISGTRAEKASFIENKEIAGEEMGGGGGINFFGGRYYLVCAKRDTKNEGRTLCSNLISLGSRMAANVGALDPSEELVTQFCAVTGNLLTVKY